MTKSTKQATLSIDLLGTGAMQAHPAEPGKVGRVAGACAAAWALYDSIADGLPVPRRMAVDLAIAQGINPATANTQFQRWVTARKAA